MVIEIHLHNLDTETGSTNEYGLIVSEIFSKSPTNPIEMCIVLNNIQQNPHKTLIW